MADAETSGKTLRLPATTEVHHMPDEPEGSGSTGLPPPPLFCDDSRALRTSCVRVQRLLSTREVEALESAVRAVQYNDEEPMVCEYRTQLPFSAWPLLNRCRRSAKAWQVLFLHTGGWFQRVLPGLRRKLLTAAYRVDVEQTWGLLCQDPVDESAVRLPSAAHPCRHSDFSWEEWRDVERRCEEEGCHVRCVEFHEQRPEWPAAQIPMQFQKWKQELDSLVTVELVLSEQGTFEGGGFQSLEPGNVIKTNYPLNRGDALVYVSHKYHRRAPLKSGVRRSLVIELWRGPESVCLHMCPSVCSEVCPYTKPQVEAEAAQELVSRKAEPQLAAVPQPIGPHAADAATVAERAAAHIAAAAERAAMPQLTAVLSGILQERIENKDKPEAPASPCPDKEKKEDNGIQMQAVQHEVKDAKEVRPATRTSEASEESEEPASDEGEEEEDVDEEEVEEEDQEDFN